MKNEKTPQVSVIIPSYNYGAYIEETVDSVLAQTFQDFEIIIVDDASTDGITPALVKQVAKKDKRIRAYFAEKNLGISGTRNSAIAKAKGIYILPLDSDDKIASTFLEKTVRQMEKAEADIVSSYLQCFGENNNIFRYTRTPQKQLPFQNSLPAGSLYRKSVWREVGGYDETIRDGYDDWDFWLGCLEKSKKFAIVDEALFYYRLHADNYHKGNAKFKHKMIRQIKNNHPSLYQWHNYYLTFAYIRHLLRLMRDLRRSLLRIRLTKKQKIICIMGVYLINKQA